MMEKLVLVSMIYAIVIFHFIKDINECLYHNGGCHGTCTNMIGSRTCSCSTGYLLGSNGYSCNGNLAT